jgi:hypothetical protein
VSWRAAVWAATFATLARSRWWLIALAAFLVRGGVVLVLPPVLLIPTPAELANLLNPSLLGTGLGSPTPLLVTVVAIASLGLLVLVVVTTLLGTVLDLALVEAAEDELEVHPFGSSSPRPRHQPISMAAATGVRLAAHVPTAVVVVVAAIALGNATTAELISPEGSGPLFLRILLRVPIAPAAVVVAWLFGEAWGGLAIRHLGPDRSVIAALRDGLRDLVRPSGIATIMVSTTVVAVPLLALWLAAGRAFDRLSPLLIGPSDSGLLLLALGLLAGTWVAGLWLLGIGLAWRSAAWTAEALRRG